MIDQTDQLNTLLESLGNAPWVSLDTEADSLHAYPEKLCLLQLSFPGSDVLLDPLAGLDLTPLWQALKLKELTLHGADYDLRLLQRTFQFVPAAIFDTMWAARLLGHTDFGLTHLVARELGVTLEKGPQKMNWAQRPLTPRMEAYARNDTRYLHPLAEGLKTELEKKGRLSWHREICEQVIRESTLPRETDPENAWRIRGSDRLSRRALAILRELWQWREDTAVQKCKPPYFILSHENLIASAEAAAHGQLINAGLMRTLSARQKTAFQEALERGLAILPPEYPSKRRRPIRPLTGQERRRLEGLRKRRDTEAQALGIDPTLIASRARLTELARNGKSGADGLMKWQRQLLGEPSE